MCGIFGAVGFGTGLSKCINALTYRGPDDWGELEDRENNVYLGHRRLSIIDLSAAGKQPMALKGERLYITYNGEVYNFQEIKATYFNTTQFVSKTDTEVILQAFSKFSYDTPKYLRGMFAFGIYDKGNNEVFLSRDRLGIKPLYYYLKDGKFAFASELEALKNLPGIDLAEDPIGLDFYFRFGYIPAPYSAYKYVKKLRPAQFLIYDIRRKTIKNLEKYWELKNKISPDLYSTEEEWIEAIRNKIKESIGLRLISDVPLGAFLSGGLDSSLVVTMMAELIEKPVKSFTIGFKYQDYDERIYAEAVAKQYKTEHYVEVADPEFLDIMPVIVKSMGEPFYDSSAIPTYYVSKIARKYVTVALSGDGGDEVFAGYSKYRFMNSFTYLNGIPIQIRKLLKHLGKYWPKNVTGYGILQKMGFESNISLYEELYSIFPADDRKSLYSENFKSKLVKDEKLFFEKLIDEHGGLNKDLITQMQLIDLHSYMPEDVLTKVDRMSMLNSLETRVPLIDHELVELVFSCPLSIRYKGKTLKYIIKKILKGRVSDDVLHHKKHGFALPVSHWFRKELKPLIKSSIAEMKNDPLINQNYIEEVYDLHQKGGRDFGDYLYAILFYKYWRDHP